MSRGDESHLLNITEFGVVKCGKPDRRDIKETNSTGTEEETLKQTQWSVVHQGSRERVGGQSRKRVSAVPNKGTDIGDLLTLGEPTSSEKEITEVVSRTEKCR